MEAKYSIKVQEVINYSREEALRLDHFYIGVEHLMLGIIREGQSVVIKVLEILDVNIFELKKTIEKTIRDNASLQSSNNNSVQITKQVERVLKRTILIAREYKKDTAGVEHLMLSILKNTENIATRILLDMGVDYNTF